MLVVFETSELKRANLIAHDAHPDAHASVCDRHRVCEDLDDGVDKPCFRSAEQSDRYGTQGKEDDPGNAADYAVSLDDVVVEGQGKHAGST